MALLQVIFSKYLNYLVLWVKQLKGVWGCCCLYPPHLQHMINTIDKRFHAFPYTVRSVVILVCGNYSYAIDVVGNAGIL